MKNFITLMAVAVLITAGGLVFVGSTFAKNMVHDNLIEQKIKFESAEVLKAAGDDYLVKYAGQDVDNGTKAYAYSQYIKGHLEKIAGGQTYSEVSAAYQKDKTNQTLAAQRQSLFMGETLRGLLLSAYGWGLMGTIAFWTSLSLFAAAAVLLVSYIYFTWLKPAPKATKKTKRK